CRCNHGGYRSISEESKAGNGLLSYRGPFRGSVGGPRLCEQRYKWSRSAIMQVPFIDISGLHSELSGELDAVWKSVTVSSSFIGGTYVDDFEAEWAAYCGADCCVGVDSGTSALELALRGLGIGPGDE